jgi:chromosome segregation ATPase
VTELGGCDEFENRYPVCSETEKYRSETDMDRAGNVILEFVKHAGETVEAELQELREAAEYLADKLRAANDQINDLEADVRRHQARADRAEEWLREISSEIEHNSARRLGFLRMSG